MRRWLTRLDLPEDAEDDVVLAVSEAASNCIEHAYLAETADGTVELTFWTEPRYLCFEIVDHGVWQEPSEMPTSRGRGIEIIRRLMASVLVRYDKRGTRVFLSYLLPDAAVAPIVLARTEEVGGARGRSTSEESGLGQQRPRHAFSSTWRQVEVCWA